MATGQHTLHRCRAIQDQVTFTVFPDPRAILDFLESGIFEEADWEPWAGSVLPRSKSCWPCGGMTLGRPWAEIIRKLEISEQTFYRWHA
jgi:predicted transcriptional regulator